MRGASSIEGTVYLVIAHKSWNGQPAGDEYRIFPTKDGMEKAIRAIKNGLRGNLSVYDEQYEVFEIHDPQWVKNEKLSSV